MHPQRLTALFFVALSAGYGLMALAIEALPGLATGGAGPATFPRLLALAGLAVALRLAATAPGETPDTRGDWRRLGLLAAMTTGYAGLLPTVGFVAATTIFLGAATRLLGERRWPVNVGLGFAMALSAWLLLSVVLDVWLPEPLLTAIGAGS
jgi:hypothetical protein